MRETLEIRAERCGYRVLWHTWRLVAVRDDGEVVGRTGEFWGPSFTLDTEPKAGRATLRNLLHRLAQEGWQLWGGTETARGEHWYNVRLYRDHP